MATRRLVLVRHAKTEQGPVDLSRALTERGRRDAAEIGRWLVSNGVAPDLAVVSPSVRTRQTWQIVTEQLPAVPPSVEDERIYLNEVADVLAVARDADRSVGTLVLVGHNPSMHACAVRLSQSSSDAVQSLVDFPTATVALLDVEGDWADMGRRSANLVAVTTCRG